MSLKKKNWQEIDEKKTHTSLSLQYINIEVFRHCDSDAVE